VREECVGEVVRVEIGGEIARLHGRGDRGREDAADLGQDLLDTSGYDVVARREFHHEVSERAPVDAARPLDLVLEGADKPLRVASELRADRLSRGEGGLEDVLLRELPRALV
jgi:hypothetical protein